MTNSGGKKDPCSVPSIVLTTPDSHAETTPDLSAARDQDDEEMSFTEANESGHHNGNLCGFFKISGFHK